MALFMIQISVGHLLLANLRSCGRCDRRRPAYIVVDMSPNTGHIDKQTLVCEMCLSRPEYDELRLFALTEERFTQFWKDLHRAYLEHDGAVDPEVLDAMDNHGQGPFDDFSGPAQRRGVTAREERLENALWAMWHAFEKAVPYRGRHNDCLAQLVKDHPVMQEVRIVKLTSDILQHQQDAQLSAAATK